MQFEEDAPWIARFNVRYHLGVDGISIWFVLLTAFITVIVVIAGWEVITDRVHQYMGAFLILSGLMVGVFCALDGAAVLRLLRGDADPDVHHHRRVGRAAPRLRGVQVLPLHAGRLAADAGRADLPVLQVGRQLRPARPGTSCKLPLDVQTLLFFAFLAAFAVKVPMWPVHTWLPDAHVEAPTGGSVVLAAIMLKLGAYGFLRFSLPIAPDAAHEYAWLIIALSLIAVIYIGLVALVQQDMKKLVAYSSIAHMGFVTLGFFMFNELGMSGGLVQMISHGFVSGAMFLCIGVLYDRVHSREIASYGGVVNTMPNFAAFAVLFAMANCGLPGTAGFVGEWMVILGTVKVNFWLGAAGRHGADLRRRLHAVDGQAGVFRRDRQRRRARADRHQCARVPDAGACWRSPCCGWACIRSRSPT